MRTVELLELISQGGKSVTEIAVQIDMDKTVLMDRLSNLERMGYLRKLELGEGCGTRGCGSCPMRRSCDGGAASPVIFVLTEKGKRALKK